MPATTPDGAVLSGAAADRIIRRFPSFCDFVDDALFHPRWGYYSTGGVRFGTGGHFDTYPLALSPLFGRMVAEYAFKLWHRRGHAAAFEISADPRQKSMALTARVIPRTSSADRRALHARVAGLQDRVGATFAITRNNK